MGDQGNSPSPQPSPARGEGVSRARTFTSDAIVLRRMDFGEADRILTVLTPYHGKLRLLAKGVRRPGSRMAGHLELFVHARVQVARGRSLDLMNQAVTLEAHRAVREDMTKAAHAFYLAELVDGFLEEGDHHPSLFSLLLEALDGLEEGTADEGQGPEARGQGSGTAPTTPPTAGGVVREEGRSSVLSLQSSNLPLLDRQFELHLLAAVGFRPQLTECVSCRAELKPETNGYSVKLGGVLCPDCFAGQPATKGIRPDVLKLLRYLQRTSSVGRITLAVPEWVLREAEQVLREQLEFALERRLRAADFLRQVGGPTAGGGEGTPRVAPPQGTGS